VSGREQAIVGILRELGPAVVAVSGGVDSMTLAHLAARHTRAGIAIVHAVSPAVPAAATVRVRDHAERFGWRLTVLDAGEFADPRYRANPIDRCYFCKANLYGVIAARFTGVILSGTNCDDLGDFRPGLRAAAEQGVRHPFVEAGIGKAEIRELARGLSLDDLAELPAAPCLSSRVETGIAINADDLALVDVVEGMLRQAVGPIDLRCRIGHAGVRIELGENGLADLPAEDASAIMRAVEETVSRAGRRFLGYGPYRRGSAFLRARGAGFASASPDGARAQPV
jgi:uncharacterized protein